MLAACKPVGENPDSYANWVDQLKARSGGVLGMPCGGSYDLSCFKFQEPRRMRGMWLVGLETSEFIDEYSPSLAMPRNDAMRATWLDYPRSQKRPFDGAYEIDLIGRASAIPGHFGHEGMSDQVVIVDRILSIKPVPFRDWDHRYEQVHKRD